MNIPFWKYQGTGNDFILIDQMEDQFLNTDHQDEIRRMCDRHFGIGADGLILIEPSAKAAFKMVYFNSDGKQSSMCGNGGRCIVKLASELGYFNENGQFEAIDGLHEAFIDKNNLVHLKMNNVLEYSNVGKDFVLNTGSPHYVKITNDLTQLDLAKEARKIRFSAKFEKEGINVNFVEYFEDRLMLRTYERGVEDETLSCGTGVTAAALIGSLISKELKPFWKWQIESRGGKLEVEYEINVEGEFVNIWLTGPAECAYTGEMALDL